MNSKTKSDLSTSLFSRYIRSIASVMLRLNDKAAKLMPLRYFMCVINTI